MAEVQILLGTRDGGRYLGPQLASFAGQTLNDWSLVASDDGSSDNSIAILERFGAARPGAELRVVSGPRLGVAANYLHLLEHADEAARYVALSDQDDIWFPEKLLRATQSLRRLPPGTPAIYGAQSRLIDAAGRPLKMRRLTRKVPSFSNALVQNILAGNTIVLNNAALQLSKRAMPSVMPPFHDWWLYALICGVGGRVVIDQTPVLGYRQHRHGVLGAHAGWAARAKRATLLANGTWRQWALQHHAALGSVSAEFLPAHRAQLEKWVQGHRGLARLSLMVMMKIHRQSIAGTAALGAAAMVGLL